MKPWTRTQHLDKGPKIYSWKKKKLETTQRNYSLKGREITHKREQFTAQDPQKSELQKRPHKTNILKVIKETK